MPAISYTVFFSITVSLLLIALVLACRVVYLIASVYWHPLATSSSGVAALVRVRVHDLMLVHLIMLLPSVETLLNFLPRDSLALFDGGQLSETQPYCYISGFSTVASLTARVGMGAAVAYFTYKTVANPSQYTTQYRREIILAAIASWAVGCLVSTGYILGGVMGPFRGLFCCVQRLDLPSTSFACMLLYVGLIVYMTIYFRKAIIAVSTVSLGTRGKPRSTASIHPSTSASGSPSAGVRPMDATMLAMATPKTKRRAVAMLRGEPDDEPEDGDSAGSTQNLSTPNTAARRNRRLRITTRVHTTASLSLTKTGIYYVSSFAVAWSLIVFASFAEFLGTMAHEELPQFWRQHDLLLPVLRNGCGMVAAVAAAVAEGRRGLRALSRQRGNHPATAPQPPATAPQLPRQRGNHEWNECAAGAR